MKTRSRNSAHERGAALIVAIGILALLLVISVSFFRMATQEMQVATNYANSIQGELLVDGAIAIAIDTLQQDAIDHPGYTSNDHAWRSRFNGSWAVGKNWTFPVDQFGNVHKIYDRPIHYPPLVDLDQLNFALQQYGTPGKPELDIDLLHRYMYIPRFTRLEDDSGSPVYTPTLPGYLNPETGAVEPQRYLDSDTNFVGIYPFAFTTDHGSSNMAGSLVGGVGSHPYGLNYIFYGADPNDPTSGADFMQFNTSASLLPEQQVHFFTDVDNDGDGLNDSMWFPAAADTLYPNDGIDNDLDGYIDGDDPDGEPGVFFYSTGYDSTSDFDNIDDRNVFLTMPLHRMFSMRLANTNNPWVPLGTGLPGGIVVLEDLDNDYGMRAVLNVGSPSADDKAQFGDDRDNDFNSIINDGADASHYVLNRISRLAMDGTIPGNDPIFVNHFRYDLLDKILTALNNDFEIRILGETDSELTARIGIYITDEASKVNINEAGGLTYVADKRDLNNSIIELTDTPMVRSALTGRDASQYDLRSLNQIEETLSERIWNVRMGSILRGDDPSTGEVLRNGSGLATDANPGFIPPTAATETNFGSYAYDVSFPGYGFVDDNGSALWMATNGVDDDGDAFWYQSDGIDNDMNGIVDDAREGVDEGLFPYDMDGLQDADDNFAADSYPTLEGIDEPQEYQNYRPYRNFIAEQDFDSPAHPDFNSSDDSDNDSDGVPNEIGELGDRPFRTTGQLKIVESINGTDDGDFSTIHFREYEPFITAHSSDDNLSRNYRAGNGFANASTRTPSGVKLDINFATPEEIVRSLTQNFNYDASVPYIVDGLSNAVVDPDGDRISVLARAFASGLRQEDTTVVSATEILNLGVDALTQDSDLYDEDSVFEQVIFPSDPELRAHQLAVSAKDFADADFSRSTLTLTADDEWLNFLETGLSDQGGNTMTYTQAGVEAIRINEIMVRPVRRVEAEATTITTDARYIANYDPNYFGADDFRVRPRTMLDELRTRSEVTLDPDPGNGDYWAIQEGPPAASNLPVMGLRTAWATYQTYIGFFHDDDPGDNEPAIKIDIPNLLEFRFQASDQLPAGRYYLTMNSQVISHKQDLSTNVEVHDIVNSVFSSQDFLYYTRRGDDDSESILETLTNQVIDVARGIPLNLNEVDILTTVQSPAALGRNGMSFMQSHEIYNGFTVQVPETGFLYVAIARNRPDPEPDTLNTTTPLAVNWFDFSQEPDHEYVELVNVSDSDEPIDLSGWKLTVAGDSGIEMTIPNDTFIAPGGYLLLGSNKFDYLEPISRALNIYDPDYQPTFNVSQFVRETISTIYANGIGLARGEVPGADPSGIDEIDDWFVDVTEPPMFANVESVFDRGSSNFDFVDDQGDGVDDDPTVGIFRIPGMLQPGVYGSGTSSSASNDDNIVNTVDVSRDPARTLGLTATDKPWDRIVELEIPVLEQLDSIGAIGRFVLNGGLFPNYPEQDGIDNDGDNARLVSDIYDNDGDGFAGAIDSEFDEGIDEGRLRLHPGNINIESVYAGGYQNTRIPLNMTNPFNNNFEAVPYPITVENPATPNLLDPPAWKALVEERLFPGDNVIVTLYEGSRYGASVLGRDAEDHVVDRITYTELDVIDRAKDDIIDMPSVFDFTRRNNALPSLWAANTMGIDFYKSLERKHPFYNGDKHGTTNRNEATDGNYDDWADASNYNARELYVSEQNLFDFNAQTNQTIDKMVTAGAGYENLFRHTLFGSPLRMNISQRIAENPSFVRFSQMAFVEEGQFDAALNADFLDAQNGVTLDRQLIYPQVAHRNRPLVSPGDLMTMPHYDRIEQIRAVNLAEFAVDFSAPNQRIIYDGNTTVGPMYTDTTVRQIMLGHTFADLNWNELYDFGTFFNVDYRIRDNDEVLIDNGGVLARGSLVNAPTDIDGSNDLSNDLTQLIANTAASDSQSLSVATANVVPLSNGGFDVSTDYSDATSPLDWSPVLLFELNGDPGTFDVPGTGGSEVWDALYLFDSTLASPIPGTVNVDRWTLARRAVSYASRNDNGGRKDALFIWDGNDGIENGEYDVYIGVNEDLRPIMQSHLDNSALSGFGQDFVDTALRTDSSQMTMNINVFTDRDGDSRVWSTSNATPTSSGVLNSAASASGINEAFGAIINATPDRNGFINYGSVTVENNYLAVLLENTADPSVLNRITRVVLAPRAKTPGRININSIETQFIADEGRYFNPLIGMPGIQFGYDEFERTFGQALINSPAVTLNPVFSLVAQFFDPSANRASIDQRDDYIHWRARKIIERRDSMQNIHPDGRYYESITDLIQPVLTLDDNSVQRLEYPTILSELTRDSSISPANHPTDPDLNGNEESPRFQEIQNRFSRMANMITTRSDVFKIYVTVQTGYVDDLNGDGILNYRDDTEFTVTSEQKATTIYER